MMIGLGKIGYIGKPGNISSGGIMLPEVQASGRSFPIWNTIAGDDKLLTLSIHGRTEQDGTPTPEAPVPLQSVGDESLYLYVMQDKEGGNYQTLDIKTAMQNAGHDGILRSVNGIYDEVVYNGKEWKLIQRIGSETLSEAINMHSSDYSWCTYSSIYDYKLNLENGKYGDLFASNKFVASSGIGGVKNSVGLYSVPTNICATTDKIYETIEECEAYIGTFDIIGVLAEPIEYPLDLPVITTYDNQTYFATNSAEVKPRMVAQCQVSEKLDYIKEGLLGYWTGRERSNTETNRDILPDLSGNGNDLTNYNMAYTIESGYGDGYIQYDGIDDFSGLKTSIPATKRTVLFTVSRALYH